jgi:phage terminase large subunit GpA-like protein
VLATDGMVDARDVYAHARALYAARVRVGAVTWAETERVLSAESSAEAGRYSLDRTPWWREVMEAFADEATEEVIVAKSSQVGYTELLNTFIGWCMAEDPSSMLFVAPTVEMVEAHSKERLDPMMRDTPALRGILRGSTRGMARSSDDTLRRKLFPGGWLALIGANSPSALASRPVRRVIGDELDRWPVSAGDEGSPLELARRRTITYWNRKIISGGTPTEEGGSVTWDKWEQSDQRRWYVACPHCGHEQPLRWKDDAGQYHIVCDRDAEGRLIPETAAYRCADCAALIDERDKAGMVAAGRWVAERPGRTLRGYHVWAAYSPWMTWAEIIREFEAARGAEALLRVFVNTLLGLPFAPVADRIEPAGLMARAESMPKVPAEVGLLTAGVDVQDDRLEVVIVGWGEGERACVLEYAQVEGDPGQRDTWVALGEMLRAPREAAVGAPMPVTAVAVDSGHRPEAVWANVNALPGRHYVVKGRGGRGWALVQPPGATTRKAQRRPWMVGTDTAKDSLASRLRSKPDGPQGVRFADALPPEYFEHLTAEELRTTYVAGRPVRTWVLRGGRRNEGLDCTVYALAALHALGTATVARLGSYVQRRAPDLTPAPEPAPPGVTVTTEPSVGPEPVASTAVAARRPTLPRRNGGGWMRGWGTGWNNG